MPEAEKKTAVIIGAGPAGLTAAFELLSRTGVVPVVLEQSNFIGGLSRTATYKGNRIDIGGHRFFSRSDRIMKWWLSVLPLQKLDGSPQSITYQQQSRDIAGSAEGPDPQTTDRTMLLRQRKSRIYFLRRFFDYPISLSLDTIRKLGLVRMTRIGFSYIRASLFPVRNERTLEQFFINRFGRALYRTFFKSYTEKVWGVPCDRISAAWGAQRIKGLSIMKAVAHGFRKVFGRKSSGIGQKGTETSLIEQFLYPKLGPGQMWEEVARQVEARSGPVLLEMDVTAVHLKGNRAVGVTAVNRQTGESRRFDADYVFSTMPIKDLYRAFDEPVPPRAREVAEGLVYRDFITVGMLVKKLKVSEAGAGKGSLIRDNWIYIQEPDVQLGRLQIFNNWSPWLVADPGTVWLGLEYFCNEGDDLWKLPDERMIALARAELARIGILEDADFLDAVVIRVPKTYPAYFGSYDSFPAIREHVDSIENLFLIGRNGMHRYNNQDHSMLTAITAVENIAAGRTDKANIWDVNTEQDYHEGKPQAAAAGPG
ncbi:MAG: NAD(P)/FAD-dependent oxidoreductase [Planctomycetes bacterium]|nr:NAD(P)/FAD-dependent oxidoreductase [Planctomycetota bacterium]